MNRRTFLGGLPTLALAPLAHAADAPLDVFLKKPEPEFKWEKKAEKKVMGGTLHDLFFTSQVWQGRPWTHRLQLFIPEKNDYPDFCTLLNTGGGGSQAEETMGMLGAGQLGGAFAILYHIPNQPLYGLTEDALIVYTWQKYLETGDTSWPLHFPMAKAVLKAMDVLQAAQPSLKRFLITGASKRGWTTWLAGASRDKRIVGIAPMVIDILNVAKQTAHQLEMYGKPSEQVADYTAVGMDKILATPRGQELLKLEDPYSYRDRLTLPKLIILGTNDRYWSQDALNLYWKDLRGPKWVLYTPNSGHGLEDRARVFATLSAFGRMLASRKRWPKQYWVYTPNYLKIDSDMPLESARIFTCTSDTTDFRDSKWTSIEKEVLYRRQVGTAIDSPHRGYAATFLEVTYELEPGRKFTLSTQISILRPKV
ncbi:MAG: PhoPQ-activated protein PqaA family protein [Armatimonas sp.]